MSDILVCRYYFEISVCKYTAKQTGLKNWPVPALCAHVSGWGCRNEVDGMRHAEASIPYLDRVWLGSKPKPDSEAVELQIGGHHVVTARRIGRERQTMACAWLQIDGDVRGRRVQGADVPQVIDVVAVTIADRVVIFADEDLQNSVSAT